MNRENTREYDRGKEYCEYNRSGNRDSEGRKRMVDAIENPWNIPDEEEHKRSASPEEMIINKVDGFSNFFCVWDFLICEKCRNHEFYITTSP